MKLNTIFLLGCLLAGIQVARAGQIVWTIAYTQDYSAYANYTAVLVFNGVNTLKNDSPPPAVGVAPNGTKFLENGGVVQGIAHFAAGEFTDKGGFGSIALSVEMWADRFYSRFDPEYWGSMNVLHPERWLEATGGDSTAEVQTESYAIGGESIRDYYLIVFDSTTIGDATKYAVIADPSNPDHNVDDNDTVMVGFTFDPDSINWVTVPEPTAGLLLGLGATLFSLRRRLRT